MPGQTTEALPSAHPARDDGDLARAIAEGARGDEEAELYRRLAPRVRAYGLRHLRDASLADDLVQSALVLVLDKLRAGEVHEPARITSFVLGTCRHLVRDWRRGERRRDAILAETAPALRDLAECHQPTALVDGGRVAGCLEQLPPRWLTVILLSFFAERSGTEIADELGTSPGNVRVIRHRALESLHDCVEGGGR